jgi:2-keto-4-pentenoate hydratase/2-oxohepta-3-ene-1,7-dioic acid hydratase in catechol pathway
MRLVSFEIATPLGRATRTGAVDAEGRYVNLNAAYRARLVARGALNTEAAHRIAAALVPDDMRAFVENGDYALEAARLALERVTAEGELGPDGATLVNAPKQVRLLAPIPRPPLIRDFMGFEEHLKNIFPRLGRDIPSQWYEMPVYYKGNPSSVGADGDVIELPSYADSLDFEFEFAG